MCAHACDCVWTFFLGCCKIWPKTRASLFTEILLHKSCCVVRWWASYNFRFIIPVCSHLWMILGSFCTLQSPTEQPTDKMWECYASAAYDACLVQLNICLDNSCTASLPDSPHLVGVRVVEEVGPVWIRLHEPELKQLPEAQLEDVETDLETEGEERFVFTAMLLSSIWYSHSTALAQCAAT